MPSQPEITVCVPSIPPRRLLLLDALASVAGQTLPAAAISVAVDVGRRGAWHTRQRALEAVRTPWVAFLDDDDILMPEHLETLYHGAVESGADYVYSYYQVVDTNLRPINSDPLGHFGRVFDPADPIQTTIVTLVRTELAMAVGFDHPPEGGEIDGQRHGEDYSFTCGVVRAGGKVVHIPRRTWYWRHWLTDDGRVGNTSGQPDRW